MDRRGFLKLLGGAALATQIPVVLVPAEEEAGDYCVRYIRAYDVFSNRIIERLDMAIGMELPLPKGIEAAQKVSGVSRAFITQAIKTMKHANIPPEAVAALESECYRLKPGMLIGVDFTRNTPMHTLHS